MCQAYIVREHMKLKCNDNHTISRQSEIKIEHKSFLHFPIIKDVTVQRNLIKISNKQNSSRLIQLIPRLGHAFIYALKPIWIQSPAAVPEKRQAMPFSLLWLIPAALWVSAAKQDAHKTQEKVSSNLRRTPIKLNSAVESGRERKACICYSCCSWRCELWRRFARLLGLWANQKGTRWTDAKAWAVSKCSNLCRTRRSQTAAGPTASETEGTVLTSTKVPDRKKEAWVLICSKWGAGLG